MQPEFFTGRKGGKKVKKRLISILSVLAMSLNFAVYAESAAAELKFKDFLSGNPTDFTEKDDEFVRINKAGIDSAEYTVDFEISKEDDYSAELIASAYTANSVSLSRVKVQFDESAPLALDTDFDTAEYGASGTTYIRHKFSTKNKIRLSQGSHTMKVIGEAMEGGRFRYEMKSLKIEKYTEPLPSGIIVSGDTKIEAEDVITQNIVSDAGASGGNALIYFGLSAEQTAEIPFYVMKPGEYNLNISAACEATNKYISPIGYIVDSGEIATISEVYKSFDTTSLVGGNYVKNFPMKIFRVPQKLQLDKGYHKITFKFLPRSSDQRVFACLDYIELVTDKDINELNIKTEKGYAEIGKDTALHLYGNSGDEITEVSVFSEFMFTTGGMFARLKNKNVITGTRYGKENVSLEFDYGSNTYKADSEVYVTDKNGLALVGAERKGNTVSISVLPLADYHANEDYILVYVYEQTNGVLHSVKNVYRLNISDLSGGTVHTLTQDIDADEDDAQVILLFNAASDKAAAYSQIILGQEGVQ